MKNEFVLAINEITDARALPRDVIIDAVRTALVSAYRRDVSVSSAQSVEAEIDLNTGMVTLLVEKEVVTDVNDPRTEVTLDEALTFAPGAELGETVMAPIEDTARKFGRIAAQTAKQIILQKIREAERESLYTEYVEREGDLITGTVQSVSQQGVTVSLGRAEALLPRAHMMPGERYKPHDKVRAFLLEVKKGNRGPQIIISRSHRNMLRRLLEYEVPEIYNGQVEIKNIAREAGYRSKVAVAALQDGVDPVGACVGMRGIRIQNIVRELSDEKIDVIEWNADPAIFITKALSPARVSGVYLDEFADAGRGGMGTATVIVPDDQLSLAIGREGQNARLAAKLTGWRIDIKSVTESAVSAIADSEAKPLAQLNAKNADLLDEVKRILAKRDSGRPVMPEEFQTLTQYARLAEQALLTERRGVNKKHQDYIKSIRKTLPERAFELPLENLGLPAPLTKALTGRFESVGEVMLYMRLDENRVASALERVSVDDALGLVRAALETVQIPAEEEAPVAVEPEVVETSVAPVAETAAVEEAELALADEAEVEAPPAIIEPELPVPAKKVVREVYTPLVEIEPEPVAEPALDVTPHVGLGFVSPDAGFDDDLRDKDKDRKAKERRRELVFDEDAGKVVAKRKRKGSRKRQTFYEYDEEE